MYIHAEEYQRTYWMKDDNNSEKTFYNTKNAAAMIAIMSALGFTTTVIIPKRVQYSRVKNVKKNTYQKNFTAVQSKLIIT